VRLDAARDINLIASQDTQQTSGKNSSSGGSIGVGLGVGSGGAGISISANANSSKGHEKGNGVWQNETTVDGGNQLTINSGRDTTLAGAQVSGEAVVADIGRDLTIASTQDSDHYDSKQHSVSGGLGYTFGAGGFSGSISASRDKLSSDYDSVQEQSGIFAGKGGFDVTVGNHTQLDGGVIASTAEAGRNRLDTGTLGFSDIHNRAEFETEHQGAGLSSGGSIGSQFAGNMANGLLAGGGNSGDAQGTTRSAVSEGTLTVRDTANQQQDVANLSRDTEHANGSISPIFDKEKEQRRLQEVQLIGEIGSQAADIARTQGEINGLNAARAKLAEKGTHEPGPDASDKDRNDYQKALRETSEYKTAMEKYGTGGNIQRGIQAATAALSGLAGDNIAGALAGAAAPELAYRIGHQSGLSEDDVAARAIAHAILGGAVAAVQGNSAAAGTAGTATGELAAKAIAGVLYPDVTDLSKLSEEQKQTISTLATISAGMAGGLAGDSAGSAVAGGQAGKNTAENNSLAGDKARESVKESSEWWKEQIRDKLGKNTASQLANGLVNLASATGDLAMLGGDTAFDLIAALATCATGNSYCSQAKSDIAKKDAAAANVLNDIIKGDAWEGIKSTAVKAANGDQKALENVAEVLSGAFIPAKILPEGKSTDAVSGGKGTSAKLSYVEEPPFNPSGTAGAAQPWSTKGRINYVQLPNEGKIRYVPPEGYSASQPLPRGPNNGYIDKFGNEWVKGPSRTAGQAFEWDVQLSRTGKAQLGWATRDGSHLNISLDGRITHK